MAELVLGSQGSPPPRGAAEGGVTSTKLKGPRASMKSSLHWSVKSASLSRLLIMEFTSCNLGGGGRGMGGGWRGGVRIGGCPRNPSHGQGTGRPQGLRGGSARPVPSPYGDHVCPVTVIAGAAQVEKGRDIVGGHGSAHVPRDHSDPGDGGTGGVTTGHHPLPSSSLPQGS